MKPLWLTLAAICLVLIAGCSTTPNNKTIPPKITVSPTTVPTLPPPGSTSMPVSPLPKPTVVPTIVYPIGCSANKLSLAAKALWQQAVSFADGGPKGEQLPLFIQKYIENLRPTEKNPPKLADQILQYQKLSPTTTGKNGKIAFAILIREAVTGEDNSIANENVTGSLDFSCRSNKWIGTSWKLPADPF